VLRLRLAVHNIGATCRSLAAATDAKLGHSLSTRGVMATIIQYYLDRNIVIQKMTLNGYYSIWCMVKRSMADFKAGRSTYL